jgi:hypothetical protein
VIPFEYQQLARLIHQERIQAAQAARPEWMYAAPARARRQGVVVISGRELRRRVAQSLHQLAAYLEPLAS